MFYKQISILPSIPMGENHYFLIAMKHKERKGEDYILTTDDTFHPDTMQFKATSMKQTSFVIPMKTKSKTNLNKEVTFYSPVYEVILNIRIRILKGCVVMRVKRKCKNVFCTIVVFTLFFSALPGKALAATRQEPSFRTSASMSTGTVFIVDRNEDLWIYDIFIEGTTKETQNAKVYQSYVTDHVIAAAYLYGDDYLVLKENGDLWFYQVRGPFSGNSSFITPSLLCRDVAILKGNGIFLTTDNRLHKVMFHNNTPYAKLIAEGVLDFLAEDCYITQSRTITITDSTFDVQSQLSGIQRLFESGLARFALMENGDLYGWGYNQRGTVGNGGYNNGFSWVELNPGMELPAEGDIRADMTVHSFMPTCILQNVEDVFPMEHTVCAVDKSGTYWKWGGAPTPAHSVWTNGQYELVMPPEQYLRPAVCTSYVEPKTANDVNIAEDGSIWVIKRNQCRDASNQLVDNHKKVVLPDGKRGILGADFYVNTKTKTGNPVSSWAVGEVNEAISRNLCPTSFADKDLRRSITRREFADMAVTFCESLLGTTIEPDTDVFSDTDDSSVLKAYRLGITSGVGGGRFAPEAFVTRQEAAVMLRRAYVAAGRKIPVATEKTAFTDAEEISDWAYADVCDMAGIGSVKGNTKGQFCPKNVLSREAALLIALRLAVLE